MALSTTTLLHRTFDASLILKDAGLVAADAAATVAAVAKILDIGRGQVFADWVTTVSAIEVATGDENYLISLQGSNSATFASGIVVLAQLELGDSTTLEQGADSVIGKYVVPFRNILNGVHYRYVRLYTNVSGTIATGINYDSYLAKRQ